MNSLRDRNPSPPPEILENHTDFVPDRIGNSMYSKRWLYKTLMKMLKVVEEHANVEKGKSSSKSVKKESEESSSSSIQIESEKSSSKCAEKSLSKSEEEKDSSQSIVELDPKVEEDACTLWDMSANSEVAEFLCEIKVTDLFLSIILRTKSPRLLEIVVGILGNMSSFKLPRRFIKKNTKLIDAVIMLSGCSDSCTLVQVFRLLSCGIADLSYQDKWYYAFERKDSHFMKNLKNILENNLCRDVLQSLLQLLNRLLSYYPCYCDIWLQESHFMAIIESGKQLLRCNQSEDLESFWSVLWSMDLVNETHHIPIYVVHFNDLKPLFEAFILKFGEEETLPPPARLNIIGQTLILLGKLVITKISERAVVKFDNDVLRALMHMYRLVKSFVQKHVKKRVRKREHESSDEETENSVSSITQTIDTNSDHGSPEAEEFASTEDSLIVQAAYDNIVYCIHCCCQTPKDAEGLEILDEVIEVNHSHTPDFVRNIGKQ